jgi:transcriptional regulator with XRE-family HTH domain
MAGPQAGLLVRDWRVRRHRSQMDLALDVGVSPRHLSFVETGRSRASPELLLALAEHLEVPLRERNTLLMAGGYAPRYPRTGLDSPEMDRVRSTLERILGSHDPYPGVVIDRYWNVVLSNAAAQGLLAGLPDHVLGPPANIFRVSLHPDGLASRTINFTQWSTYLLSQLHRATILTGDAHFEHLTAEVSAYPNVVTTGDWRTRVAAQEPEILVPLRLDLGGTEVSLFTTLTVFGTPQDVTLSELAVELFYPADERSEIVLRSVPDPPPPAESGDPAPGSRSIT